MLEEDPPQFVLHKKVGHQHLRDYRAVVPDKHRLEGDALMFLSEMIPSIKAMFYEELVKQHGIKNTLLLKAELEKVSVSSAQVYNDHA